MDPAFYVRIEGVNLSNFLYDVHDLSTIRGGSFLLLDGVRRLHEEFSRNIPDLTLQPLSTGASSGLFVCRGWKDDPAALGAIIEEFFHGDDDLKHATFVVDVYAKGDAFDRERESVMAMNRWRQFQQPTLAVPSGPSSIENRECRFDHVRPAVARIRVGDKSRPASASVQARREFGKTEKRRDFYVRELTALAQAEPDAKLDALIARTRNAMFVNDFEHLTSDASRGSLDSKIAIVYLDGNGFGSIQRKCDETTLPQFDAGVKRFRRTALRRLLEMIEAEPDGWLTEGESPEIRLETLLWGGDELIWVVPAWKGWDVARLFYEVSRDWTFNTEPLTHAGGVVFCHHAAHIHRMTGMAKDLAESCKRWIKSHKVTSHSECDLFAYQVLESFDVIGMDLEAFRATRVPLGHSTDELFVRGAAMPRIAELFSDVRTRFPRSKLHDIVSALRQEQEKTPAPRSMTKKAVAIIESTIEGVDQEVLKNLFDSFAPANSKSETPWNDEARQTAWFHMAELWDYIPATSHDEERAR